MNAVPRKLNGRIDWGGYIRTTWPILLVLGTILYHLGGRLETPAQKSQRIRDVTRPTVEKVRELHNEFHTHEREDGHRTMVERVRALERRVQRLEDSP